MLLVKKCTLFINLFLVKIRLEIMFNNVLDRKETFFGHKKSNLSKSQKSHFSKGVNPCFWSKNAIFFLNLFLVEIRVEIMLKTLQSKKKPFGAIKSRIFNSVNSRIFPKGLTHAFGPKNANFFFNGFWSKQD